MDTYRTFLFLHIVSLVIGIGAAVLLFVPWAVGLAILLLLRWFS